MKQINLSLVVAFAQMWGIVMADNRTNEEVYSEMMSFDSDVLAEMFSAWAEEYLSGDYDDTCDFFEEKVKNLFSDIEGGAVQ